MQQPSSYAPTEDPTSGFTPDPITLVIAARRLLDLHGCAAGCSAGAAALLDDLLRCFADEDARRFHEEFRERLSALNAPSPREIPVQNVTEGDRIVMFGQEWLVFDSQDYDSPVQCIRAKLETKPGGSIEIYRDKGTLIPTR